MRRTSTKKRLLLDVMDSDVELGLKLNEERKRI
jgi:hypothetical protein